MNSSNHDSEILIIDDNEGNVKLLMEMLVGGGYQVRTATSAPLALRSIQARPPALILLDVRMPEMDGFEICRRLKADEQTRSIPVMFITILETEQDKIKGFELGAVDYITKPFSEAEVLARVRTHLELRRYQEQLEDLVRERTAQLAQSTQRISAHIDNSPLAVIEFDPQFRVTLWSREAERVFGWAAEEMLGKSIGETRWVYEEDAELVNRECVGLFSGERSRSLNVNRNYRKDGTVVQCEWYNSAIYDTRGELVSVLSQVLDITERKQADERLASALDEARLRQKETAALLKAAQAIPLSATFDEAARQIFDSCKELIGAKSGYVALLSDDGAENKVLFLEAGGLPCDVDPELPMPIRGLREVAYRTKEAAYENDFARSEWMKFMPQGHVALENVLFAPLNIGDAGVGLIGIANKPGGFNERDAQTAKAFGDLAAVALNYAENREELRKSRMKYHDLVETSQDLIWQCDAEGRYTYLNPAWQETFGYAVEEMLGKRFADFQSPEHAEQDLREFAELMQGGSIKGYETVHLRKDGSEIPLVFNAKCIADEQGNIIGTRGTAYDITERKQAEKELRESEERLRQIIEQMPYPVEICDPGGTAKMINQAFLSMFNIPSADLVVDKYNVFNDSMTMELIGLANDIQRVYAGELVFIPELTIPAVKSQPEFGARLADEIVLETTMFPVFRSTGEIWRVVTIWKDVTNRKQAEEALRESKERYQRLVENSPDMVYTFSSRRGGIYYSPRVEQILGYAPEYLYAHPFLWNESIHPDDRIRISQIIRDFASGKPFEIEYRIRDARGNWLWLNDRSIGRSGGDGEILIEGLATDITTRKQAEEALRISQINFVTFFNSVEDLLFVLDTAGNIIKANTTACRRLKYAEEELIGQSVLMVHPPQRRTEAGQIVMDMLSGRRRECPVPVMKKDGGLIEVETYITRGKWNGQDALFGVTKDISALKRSEDKFAKAFRMNSTAMAISTLDGGVYVDVNDAFCRNFGFAREETLGRTALDLALFDESARRQDYIAELSQTGSLRDREMKIRTRDGDFREGLFSAEQIELDGIPHLLTMFFDLTERKKAEEQLRASEARAQAMLNAIPDLMFRLDRRGVFLDYRADVKDLYVQPDAQIIGKHNRDITPPEFADFIDGQIRLTLESGALRTFEYQLTIPGKGARDYEARMAPSGADEVTAIVRDVTERKRAEDEIRQLNATLEQRVDERTRELHAAQEQLIRQEKLAALGQMAGSVGHELRNPLGVISNAVYFLKMTQSEAPGIVIEYLDIIQENVNISNKIVEDLLDFTRVKSVDRIPLPVADTIRETLKRFPAPAPIQVAFDLPEDLPRAYADPQHVTQILGNLTMNACQAMSTTPEKLLTVSSGVAAGEIWIAVKDTGCGIPPENMSKLFEPLFTTRAKGIGLGLAVCKKLVEANAGRIEIESELGKGSVFHVYLPVYKERSPS